MDPPGHTVFLYLQELNRAELQKQAKLHGIRANQKSEVLRKQLQEVLCARDNVNSPSSSEVVVAEEQEQVQGEEQEKAQEEETKDDENVPKEEEEKNDEMPIDEVKEEVHEVVAPTQVEESEEEEKPVEDVKEEVLEVAVAPPPVEEEENVEQPGLPAVEADEKQAEDLVEVVPVAQQEEITPSQKEQEESTSVNEMESKNESSAWMEGDEAEKVDEEGNEVQESANAKEDETENEEDESTAVVPPQVVIVDHDNDEMAGFGDDSVVSPTAAARKMFRSKIPSFPATAASTKRRHVLGELSLNGNSTNYTSKLGKPRRQYLPKPGSVSMIIRNKNSPTRLPPSKIPRKPILQTKTCPRPKAMPLSRRNELQLQKFVERQNRGRKNREEHFKHADFANLVRSPGKA